MGDTMNTVRRGVYKDTFEEVMAWAEEQPDHYTNRCPNGKKLYDQFSFALMKYIEHLKERDIYNPAMEE